MRVKAVAHVRSRVEGRCEPSHARHDSSCKPIGNLLFASDVEAGQQFATRFQGAEYFRICPLLVGKYVQAVHAEHLVESPLSKGQRSHVALHCSDVFDAYLPKPALCPFEHIGIILDFGCKGMSIPLQSGCKEKISINN